MNNHRVIGFNAMPSINLPGTSFDFLNPVLDNLINVGIGLVNGQPNNPGGAGNLPPATTTPTVKPATNWTPLIIGGVAVVALLMLSKK